MQNRAPVYLILFSALVLNVACDFSPEEKKLFDDIRVLMDSHLCEGENYGHKYHFYRPDAKQYGPYQWLWDSGFHMITWSRMNITNSILDLRTMLQMQDRNTMKIPQMIYWGKKYVGDIWLNAISSPKRSVTEITQMPNLGMALERMYEETQDKALLQEFLPRLVEYHEWWKTHRQPEDDGKVVIIHPWESGLDASPIYDEAFRVSSPTPQPHEYNIRFSTLMLNYQLIYKWNMNKITRKRNNKPEYVYDYFVVRDVGVNAIYTHGWKIYSRLSREIGNQQMAQYCEKQYKHFLQGLLEMFDEGKGRFVSEYLDRNQYKKARANTVQSLFPIVIEDLPDKHKAAIIAQLKDPKQYKSDFPIASVALSDPSYVAELGKNALMWRGPSWSAPNYFVLYGLRYHKELELYRQIADNWKSQAINHGLWEMWNPETGKGYGAVGLGMSTSIIDVIHRLHEMDQENQK